MKAADMKERDMLDMLAYVKNGLEDWEIERDWANVMRHLPIECDQRIYDLVYEWCCDRGIEPYEIWRDIEAQDIFIAM